MNSKTHLNDENIMKKCYRPLKETINIDKFKYNI